jgi:hypothetical protein
MLIPLFNFIAKKLPFKSKGLVGGGGGEVVEGQINRDINRNICKKRLENMNKIYYLFQCQIGPNSNPCFIALKMAISGLLFRLYFHCFFHEVNDFSLLLLLFQPSYRDL